MTQITIDDKSYDLNDLSDDCKAQLASYRFVEIEIQRLQGQLAALQTAKIAYARAIKETLPSDLMAGDTIKLG